MVRPIFTLAGIQVPTGPIQWEDIRMKASFNDNEAQAVVDIEDVNFSGVEAKMIDQHINDGLFGKRGIYQGMDFGISLSGSDESYQAFKGYLNFKEKYVKIHDGNILTKVNSINDNLTLQERLSALNFQLLYDEGVISRSDFIEEDYIVEKFEEGTEFLMLSFITFMTLKETIEGIKRLGESVTNVIKASTPNAGIPPSIDLGDVISASVLAILDAAYVALMIVYLKNLLRDLIDFIYPPVRQHLGMNFKTMLEKASQRIGLKLDTAIPDLPLINYIPSRPDEKDDRIGVPRPEDPGYNCFEAFDIARKAFGAVMSVDQGKLILRSENDPFWEKTSTYKMVDVLHEQYETNANDIVGNLLVSFDTDPVNAWSSVEYKGTSYAIMTKSLNDDTHELVDGFNRIDIPVQLAVRKEGLTEFEKALKQVAQGVDGLIKAFGGNSNLANKIQARVGKMKVSERVHSKPIFAHHTGNQISSRDVFSAKVCYEKYISHNSFVLNDFFGQKRLFNNVEIPFCFTDFLKTVKNSYFTTPDGKRGKFVDIDWLFSSERATVNYWIREPHSRNLIETYAESE